MDPAILGERNDAAKFDTGLKLAFASNGDGTLTVVHEDSADKFSLQATVPTEYGARAMCHELTRLWSNTQTLIARSPSAPAATNSLHVLAARRTSADIHD